MVFTKPRGQTPPPPTEVATNAKRKGRGPDLQYLEGAAPVPPFCGVYLIWTCHGVLEAGRSQMATYAMPHRDPRSGEESKGTGTRPVWGPWCRAQAQLCPKGEYLRGETERSFGGNYPAATKTCKTQVPRCASHSCQGCPLPPPKESRHARTAFSSPPVERTTTSAVRTLTSPKRATPAQPLAGEGRCPQAPTPCASDSVPLGRQERP